MKLVEVTSPSSPDNGVSTFVSATIYRHEAFFIEAVRDNTELSWISRHGIGLRAPKIHVTLYSVLDNRTAAPGESLSADYIKIDGVTVRSRTITRGLFKGTKRLEEIDSVKKIIS